jgi:hypothetical protein
VKFWQKQGALTASVTVHDGPRTSLGAAARTKSWQRTAWDFWGRLGELHYPTSQIARLMTRVQWDVTVDGQKLERDPDRSDDQTDVFLSRVTEPLDLSEVVREIALNFQVAGEVWYCHRGGDARSDGGWRVLSVVDPELQKIRDNSNALKLRGIIADPRDRRHADSPFQAILGPAEELLTLEALSRSQSRSRMSQAGILLRPSEAQFPTHNPDGSPASTFGEDLQRAMTAPIRDEYDPSALVPLDLEVPGDQVQNFRHLTFERSYDENLQERIERAIGRIAVGLDIPAELLLGIADVNHWNAWLVQEDTYRGHTEPLAYRVGDVLASAAEALELGRQVTITPDPTDLLARRSSVRDAMDAAKIGAVGLKYLRDVIGASEEDAPSDEELRIIRSASGASREPNVEERPGPPGEAGIPSSASTSAVTAQGPAEEEELAGDREMEGMGRALSRLDADLRSQLIGAVERAMDDAMRRLGAKLRTALRNGDGQGEIEGVDNVRVPLTLGERSFTIVDVEGVLRENLSSLGDWWSGKLDDARGQLEEITGIPLEDAAAWIDARDRSVSMLVDELVRWGVEDVRAGKQAPSDRLTLTELARKVVATAGGSA